MNYHEKCECCGMQLTAYTLNLNNSMANAFAKFAEKYLETGKGINKGDIGLTNPQYSNFQNLRHFGIIEQFEKGNEWYLTSFGESFYYGESQIITPVAFMGGKTLPNDHECWNTHKGDVEAKFLNDRLPEHYKKRPEYQEEKSGQHKLI